MAEPFEIDEHLTAARAVRGLVQLGLGNHVEAEADFQVTLAPGSPSNADAHRGLADLYGSRSRFAEAEESYLAAIAARPDDQELYGSLGVLYYRLGRYEDAAGQFRHTTEMAPDYFGGFRNLGGVLHMLGRYADAAAALQQALEIKQDPSVYTNLGTLYYYQGLYAEARAALEKALDLGANQYLVWGNLGDVYRMLPGREEDARDSYLRATQIVEREREAQPDDIALLGHLAEYRAKRGDADEARRLLEDAEDRPENDADTLYSMTQAYEAMGDAIAGTGGPAPRAGERLLPERGPARPGAGGPAQGREVPPDSLPVTSSGSRSTEARG